MRWVKFLITLVITLLFIALLLFPSGGLPFSIGAFLSPFQGFWQNAESSGVPLSDQKMNLPGLSEEVQIVYDQRRVPHIFANNTSDLYYTQGYLLAKDRLWQMEFQVIAAAGRLSEYLGRGTDDVILNRDRYMRRIGLGFAAERALQEVMKDPETKAAMEAYAAGVNDYIRSLSTSDLPLEYKLLNYTPEPWSLYRSCLFGKYMAFDLAGRSDDIAYTQALQLWGRETFDELYPEYPENSAPIVPDDLDWWFPKRPGYRLKPIRKIPAAPADYRPDSLMSNQGMAMMDFQPHLLNGSNNWAVSGAKSATGRPLLANDPHLGLSLPSIWYEIQLHAPGMNAYGVTFPGAPGIALGFNDSIAWGSTNSGMDVMDYYLTKFRDDRRQEYFYDGQWLPVNRRNEEFLIKGEDSYIDTVLYTHIGPVIYDRTYGEQEVPLALRWMAHEPSNEIRTFIKFNQAKNYEDYLDALKTYVCPAQNFVFASHTGDIAIWQQGRYVDKWREQGRFILDGSRRDHMWSEFVPQEKNPHVLNPEAGYVSSANQHPTSTNYPYYYTGSYEDYRGRRLHNLLNEDDTVTIEDMKAYQLDNYGVWAADILPTMLADLDTNAFSSMDKEIYLSLQEWDYQYDKDQTAPTVFQLWWEELYNEVWNNSFARPDYNLKLPKWSTTISILKQKPEFSFFQLPGDTVKRTRPMLVNQTFHRVLGKLQNDFPESEDWNWGNWKQSYISHLVPILKPFSRNDLTTSGYKHILNATSGRHGPSWRMVVSLGPKVEAYGVFPGGQTGNPGSKDFDSFVDDWVEGTYYRLWFMQGANDSGQEAKATWSFSPKK